MGRSTIGAVVWLVACSGSTTKDTDLPTPTDADTDTDTDADADADTDTDTEDTSAALQGVVRDAGGAPFEAAQLRFCRGVVCRNGVTAADGSYTFEDVAVDWFSFEVIGGTGQVTAFVPLRFESQQTRTVDITVQDAEETPIPRNAAPLDVAPGLRLEVGEGDLAEVPFEDPATEILAALVPPAQWVPTDDVAGTVLAQWAIGPFDFPAVDAAGLPMTFATPPAVAEGAELRVYVGSYETSRWEDLGTVTTQASGWSTSVGLPVLSTVLLVEE
jgi:hypothetical protein